ncbi:MAG: biotin transporter BioY [Trueperaceae bacterium]|nr:biotin transporter BioY [Trueperaceae bacterium]
MATQTGQTLSAPLIRHLVPVRSAVLRIPLQITLGVVAMALLAQVRIEIGPVPITGQTLGVLLIGAAYGAGLGSLTLLAYLIVGGLGLGVFTGAGAGWSYFSGATAGYLLSYPLVAGVVGYLAQRGWDRRFSTTALAMLVGSVLIYLPGVLWLSTFAPADTAALRWALGAGLVPFIVGDTVKLLIAAALLPSVWGLFGRRS